eukprot:gnl/Chilomastix_caulleri/1919.p1 GENE.gnl/Chilomastix_caulleri/1919~~gnl/Chilomastix_caulleri/1919.p1  ORF type:complete len:112 (+),score=21.64 gnl/Chilomastix_caulleri/1919:177-512(+)
MNASYKDYRLPSISRCPWEKVFKAELYKGTEADIYPEFIKALDLMLRYRPTQRPTAGELLTHPFFVEVLNGKIPLPSGMELSIPPFWTQSVSISLNLPNVSSVSVRQLKEK